MKVAIKCQNITKYYDDYCVFKNLSCDFYDRGLYVLYGSSGSGKTTFLNSLLGLTPITEGRIYCYGKENLNIQDYAAYITQTNYFVDYLNVYDNLRLVLRYEDSVSKIDCYLKKFDVYNCKYLYPSELSGGESQRISIIIALLQKKKILIFDEPTASLDIENRKKFFKLLETLKKDNLIICASHDSELLKIGDYSIDFSSAKKNLKVNIISDAIDAQVTLKTHKNGNLLKFMLKKLTYKNRNKKSDFLLILIVLFAFLFLFFCYNPKEKLERGLISNSSVNFVKYYCDINNNLDYCDEIVNKYKGTKNIFLYSQNVPLGKLNYGTAFREEVDYNVTALTLPFESSYLKEIDNYIVYGSYFKFETDVLLSREYALELTDNLEELIGSDFKIKLSDGEHSFIVRGIIDIDENDLYYKAYFENNGFKNNLFLNSEFVKNYQYDDILGYNEETGKAYMIAFFDNGRDLYDFYKIDDNNVTVIGMDYGFNEYIKAIDSLKYFVYPIVGIVIIATILFYFQTQMIWNKYNSHILPVFNYYGYKWKDIFLSSLLYNIFSISIKFFLSLLASFVITIIVNAMKISSFDLFLVDVKSVVLLFLFLIISSIIYTCYECRTLKKNKWLDVLKGGDDLL